MLNSLNIIAAPIYILVGSYAPADSAGISVYKLDAEMTDAELVASLSGVSNPSFQAIDKDGSVIYSVAEDNGGTSAAVAIAYDRKSHQLNIINSEPTRGGAPCYIAVAPGGDHVVTANYLGGSFSVFPLSENGALGAPQLFAFEGSGPVASRQTQPHVHCISFTPDSARLLATDLGTDRIHTYALGGDSLVDASSRRDVVLQPGSGPRHVIWNNSGDKAYLINELSGMVTVLDYDGKTLTPVQYALADTLNAAGSGDIHLSHDGRFLYASNRLKGDGLAIFAVDPDSGLISRIGYQPTGPHPRNFLITPDDRYVLVACRDSNAIEIYARDVATGLLTPTGRKINTPRPVCLTLLPSDE